jgi:hypothetical protein
MLGFIKRWAKEFDDPYVTKSLYTSLVRPNLEYASQVWSPFYQSHINRIESIQKQFLLFALRHLPWENRYHLPPYHNRLKLLGLNTLESRRTVFDIMLIHQIINGNIDCDSVKLIINNSLITNHRFRSNNIFYVSFHRTNYGLFEPINRIFAIINKYSSEINFTLSKQQQKKHLLAILP